MQKSAHVKSLDYRREIDGLRAIAVLAVFVYHLNPAWLPGGFTGVDVFFVISGFLITRIIRARLQLGTFSLIDFYSRRVRRIAPVYFAVVASTLLIGWLVLAGIDLKKLAESSAWSIFGASNIYFWRYLDISYFATDMRQTPLLHLWSLGVEEQFYLIWPALLWIMHGRASSQMQWMFFILLVLTSFWLANHMLPQDPKFSFYMLPARAGELALGACLALSEKSNLPSILKSGLSLIGYALGSSICAKTALGRSCRIGV
jgi:peptidoglycan/LPS O-acetylase OafA/YrhL